MPLILTCAQCQRMSNDPTGWFEITWFEITPVGNSYLRVRVCGRVCGRDWFDAISSMPHAARRD